VFALLQALSVRRPAERIVSPRELFSRRFAHVIERTIPLSMKYSAIASALVGALLTSTVTTRAEELVAAPQAPFVARSLNLNTPAVNVIQQPGAPASSGPQMASKKKVLIWVAILGVVLIMMLELKNQ
jgi:hypothetical protein